MLKINLLKWGAAALLAIPAISAVPVLARTLHKPRPAAASVVHAKTGHVAHLTKTLSHAKTSHLLAHKSAHVTRTVTKTIKPLAKKSLVKRVKTGKDKLASRKKVGTLSKTNSLKTSHVLAKKQTPAAGM
jgi:hypothetical protein